MDRQPSPQNASTPPERFLRLAEVKLRTGLAQTTIYEAVRKATFPAPIPLPGGRVAWLESEISEWQKTRIAIRDAKKTDFQPQPQKAKR